MVPESEHLLFVEGKSAREDEEAAVEVGGHEKMWFVLFGLFVHLYQAAGWLTVSVEFAFIRWVSFYGWKANYCAMRCILYFFCISVINLEGRVMNDDFMLI